MYWLEFNGQPARNTRTKVVQRFSKDEVAVMAQYLDAMNPDATINIHKVIV